MGDRAVCCCQRLNKYAIKLFVKENLDIWIHFNFEKTMIDLALNHQLSYIKNKTNKINQENMYRFLLMSNYFDLHFGY